VSLGEPALYTVYAWLTTMRSVRREVEAALAARAAASEGGAA
jgi:hypothetical protein